MTDNLTVEQRSFNMSRVRSAGNASTEQYLLRLLKRQKLCGWRRNSGLIGRPDFVFHRSRVAVFVDGCFWHGCPKCALHSKSNLLYWSVKIDSRDGFSGSPVYNQKAEVVGVFSGYDWAQKLALISGSLALSSLSIVHPFARSFGQSPPRFPLGHHRSHRVIHPIRP